jgi:hypothetical protein
MMLGCNKVRLRKNLLVPVINPGCSIYDKRLLFIAGGRCNEQWIPIIQIYDIERGEMIQDPDEKDKEAEKIS